MIKPDRNRAKSGTVFDHSDFFARPLVTKEARVEIPRIEPTSHETSCEPLLLRILHLFISLICHRQSYNSYA